MRNRSARWLLILCTAFCATSSAALFSEQADNDSVAKQEARNQAGEFVQNQTPAAMPGSAHSLADTKHALETMAAVFAAYAQAAPLTPPRGFLVLHNATADARGTPRGQPIPVGTGLIMLAYDSSKRLPTGRFAPEGEGPDLGSIEVNKLECGAEQINEWADGAFYYLPESNKTEHGWPEYPAAFGNTVFMTRRTQPRWLPVSTERLLNAQLEKARKEQKDVMGQESLRPQNTYDTWLKGRDERLKQYQKTHDDLAKINKQQADEFLAKMLELEKQTEKNMAASAAQQGGGLNQMINDNQARTVKAVKDLEDQLNSLSFEQRGSPAAIYLATDGVFPLLQVVPAGTKGAKPVVYPNPDFYDRTIPEWAAQSICVGLTAGPRSQGHWLYPTIVSIWNSLDWDAIAKLLK